MKNVSIGYRLAACFAAVLVLTLLILAVFWAGGFIQRADLAGKHRLP